MRLDCAHYQSDTKTFFMTIFRKYLQTKLCPIRTVSDWGWFDQACIQSDLCSIGTVSDRDCVRTKLFDRNYVWLELCRIGKYLCVQLVMCAIGTIPMIFLYICYNFHILPINFLFCFLDEFVINNIIFAWKFLPTRKRNRQ